MAQINQVAEGIYRISTFAPTVGISFNQFLFDDEHPTLIHTGTYPLYEGVRQAVSEILDPQRLQYIVVSHFEADECGGMGSFRAEAPQAVLICSLLGARVNLMQWDYAGVVRGVQDGEVLELGKHRLHFLETPHVPQWDSLMVVDETTQSLFPADLFGQPGNQPDIVDEDASKLMCEFYRANGLFPAAEPVLRVMERLERLDLQWVYPMHGGSLSREVLLHSIQTLRSVPFAFDGKILGREIPR